jgi:hypothetical protein
MQAKCPIGHTANKQLLKTMNEEPEDKLEQALENDRLELLKRRAAITGVSYKGKCRNCGKPFVKQRTWQEFCKPICRNEWHWKKTKGLLNEQKQAEENA